jgi:hypothetical protein
MFVRFTQLVQAGPFLPPKLKSLSEFRDSTTKTFRRKWIPFCRSMFILKGFPPLVAILAHKQILHAVSLAIIVPTKGLRCDCSSLPSLRWDRRVPLGLVQKFRPGVSQQVFLWCKYFSFPKSIEGNALDLQKAGIVHKVQKRDFSGFKVWVPLCISLSCPVHR